MCAALLKQSCFVEWSGNLLWSLGMVLFSFPSGASGLYFNACSLVVSFVLFHQCLSDAIPNAWCAPHLYKSIFQLNSESWSRDIFAFSDFLYCEQSWQLLICPCPILSVSKSEFVTRVLKALKIRVDFEIVAPSNQSILILLSWNWCIKNHGGKWNFCIQSCWNVYNRGLLFGKMPETISYRMFSYDIVPIWDSANDRVN